MTLYIIKSGFLYFRMRYSYRVIFNKNIKGRLKIRFGYFQTALSDWDKPVGVQLVQILAKNNQIRVSGNSAPAR